MKIIASIFILLSSFSTVASEPLHGYSFNNLGITIVVRSGGCTSKKDFKANVKSKGKKKKVQFIRKNDDLCEGFYPYGKVINFSYKEMGLERGDNIQIINKMEKWTNIH